MTAPHHGLHALSADAAAQVQNDLHLQYKMKFMFELLANGKVEELIGKFKSKGKFCGFGGIASLNKGMISGKNILTVILMWELQNNTPLLCRQEWLKKV